MRALIIANGEPPSEKLLQKFSKSADLIIATDGAGERFFAQVVIGDLDSLKSLANPHAQVLKAPSQERCDFTKALFFALKAGAREVDILGAGGLREDHALANFALFLRAGCIKKSRGGEALKLRMHSDFGSFFVLRSGEEMAVRPGAQVSIFARRASDKITSWGLKYALKRLQLHSHNAGTLNEAAGAKISLKIEGAGGYAVVYVKNQREAAAFSLQN